MARQPIDTVYQHVEERLISLRDTYTRLLQDYFDIVVTFACTHAPCTILSVVSNVVPSLLCLLTQHILVSTAFLHIPRGFPGNSPNIPQE